MYERSPWLLLVLALASACQRTEEPQSVRAVESAGSIAAPSAVAATSEANAPEPPPSTMAATPVASVSAAPTSPCVVPLPEVAPARQKPAEQCPRDPGAPAKLARGTLRFNDAPGKPRLTVERAVSPAEHQRGLMYRTKMPENQGMLFEWPSEARRVFWMHNTCIPLDMLFVAKDGTIAGILEQVPVMNDAPRTVACDAGYVLEVNAGWCRRHSVKPGTRITFE